MSLIKPTLWHSFMGDMPMPKDCTYWQFDAMRKAQWNQEDLESSARYITQLKELKSLPHIPNDEIDELIRNELERTKHKK